MTKALVADIHGFVAARGLELVSFAKGQHKDDIAQDFLAKFTQDEGVLFVGRAQEKAGVWRTQRRHNPPSGVAMPGWCAPRRSSTSSTSTAWTPEFGPFFISSAPTSDRSSQRPDEAGGSRIREAPVRAVSSPDNGGTRRDSRTAWVRLARRKGVREEPVF